MVVMRGLNGWRLLPVRHIAHFSNVSAFVLPERMPVADHEQLPMFSEDPSELLARLVGETARVQSETARAQAEAMREIAALMREVLGRTNGRAAPRTPAVPPPPPVSDAHDQTGYGPSNPRHRTWRAFALDMQRQARELPSGVKRTKTNVATHGGDTVRAINYGMKGYGLNLRDWPPDLWDPDEDRGWKSPKHK